MLRNRLVSGLKHKGIHQCLLSEGDKLPSEKAINRGVATGLGALGGGGGGGGGGPIPPPPPPRFNFRTKQGPKTSAILLLTALQKLYGPGISPFLPCVLQFFSNLRRLLIFSNFIGEIDQFTLHFLKRFDT